MKLRNVYVSDVWQPTTMMVPGCQAIQTLITSDLRTELKRYGGQEVRVCLRRDAFCDAFQKETGQEVTAEVRTIELMPGDIMLFLKSKGEPIRGSKTFPSGNMLQIYRLEIWPESEIKPDEGIQIPQSKEWEPKILDWAGKKGSKAWYKEIATRLGIMK